MGNLNKIDKIKAVEININLGWDKFIEYIKQNTKNKYVLKQCDNYFSGYKFCIDNDIDGGKCFKIREKAIHNIMQHYDLYKLI